MTHARYLEIHDLLYRAEHAPSKPGVDPAAAKMGLYDQHTREQKIIGVVRELLDEIKDIQDRARVSRRY